VREERRGGHCAEFVDGGVGGRGRGGIGGLDVDWEVNGGPEGRWERVGS